MGIMDAINLKYAVERQRANAQEEANSIERQKVSAAINAQRDALANPSELQKAEAEQARAAAAAAYGANGRAGAQLLPEIQQSQATTTGIDQLNAPINASGLMSLAQNRFGLQPGPQPMGMVAPRRVSLMVGDPGTEAPMGSSLSGRLGSLVTEENADFNRRQAMQPQRIGFVMGTENVPEMNYKKGTARVPGKGSFKKDTVPAKLAPGEAVLNKPAADMAGRGMIAALNKLGARKMGMA